MMYTYIQYAQNERQHKSIGVHIHLQQRNSFELGQHPVVGHCAPTRSNGMDWKQRAVDAILLQFHQFIIICSKHLHTLQYFQLLARENTILCTSPIDISHKKAVL